MADQDPLIETARQVERRLGSVEATVQREGRAFRRRLAAAIALLAASGFIYTTTVFGGAVLLVNRVSGDRAFANCELTNRANEGDRGLWDGILALSARADPTFPPDEQARRAADRVAARRLVEEAFAPEDCSARRESPLLATAARIGAGVLLVVVLAAAAGLWVARRRRALP